MYLFTNYGGISKLWLSSTGQIVESVFYHGYTVYWSIMVNILWLKKNRSPRCLIPY
jgi:hypothetical protein